MKQISIADNNSKLGAIPNTSLLPGRDCLNFKNCIDKCYAVPIVKQYKNTKLAWSNNGKVLRDNPESYFNQVRSFFDKKRVLPGMYRIHVSGDFISQSHVNGWIDIARDYPTVKFMAFTKSYALNFDNRPDNLEIIFSVFPDTKLAESKNNSGELYTSKIADDNNNWHKIPHDIRLAWLDNGKESRMPENTFNCPAVKNKTIKCATCKTCWSLSASGNDVKFTEH